MFWEAKFSEPKENADASTLDVDGVGAELW